MERFSIVIEMEKRLCVSIRRIIPIKKEGMEVLTVYMNMSFRGDLAYGISLSLILFHFVRSCCS